MIYIAQQNPHGTTAVWEADDSAHAIALVQTQYDHEFDDAWEAVAYDKQRSRLEPCPVHLLSGNCWPGLVDAVLSRWGFDCDDEVDLSDEDEWGPQTDGGARLNRFQCEISDLDGAEVGKINEFDVIYLPDAGRGARVGNGDAEWFDATSFRHASLFAVGEWDGETGRG